MTVGTVDEQVVTGAAADTVNPCGPDDLTDGAVRVLIGDVRDRIRELPDQSVNCVVTSPPYWALRDYGTGSWEGGSADCDHAPAKRRTRYDYALDTSPIQDGSRTGTDGVQWDPLCPACGAVRADRQLGAERTPEEYVQNMADVFQEVWRVLRADGTVWLNLGDTYARKDLQMIPARVALALRADGWFLRADVIWSKPNGMPESATDRPTLSHEHVFLLTKSPRYYYDADAIREPLAPETVALGYATGTGRVRYNADGSALGGKAPSGFTGANPLGRNKRSVWEIATVPYADGHFATFPPGLVEPCILAGCPLGGVVLDPFVGSGTTLTVARRLGRDAIGIDLDPTNAARILRRFGNKWGQLQLPLTA